MRRIITGAAIVLLTCVVGNVSAERCIGPQDNGGAIAAGVSPINASDISWCDDYDSYCWTNCGDCITGTPTSIWPGYPPTPDNLCNDTTGTDAAEQFFRKPYHWPSTGAPGSSSSGPGKWNNRFEGWNGNPGWITDPYSLQYQGFGNTSQYHTFSLVPAIAQKFPGYNMINGTDASPLVLRFWAYTNHDIGSAASNWPFYVELRLDEDKAPTDWIRSGDCTEIVTSAGVYLGKQVKEECAAEGVTEFPIVCQQVTRYNGTTPPSGCPALSTTVHASMAFGWLAQLDKDPCNVETGRKPTLYHTAVFDGLYWYDCYPNTFAFPAHDGLPAQVGKFVFGSPTDASNQAYCEMKIKTNVVEIKMICQELDPASGDAVMKTNTATVQRKYKGPFNRLSTGAGPGCQLDPITGTCVGAPQYWSYPSAGGWQTAYLDRPALLGGVGDNGLGACCQSNGTCSDLPVADCQAAGGTYRGYGTTCAGGACLGACCQLMGTCAQTAINACPGEFRGYGTLCSTPNICPCPTPFADADRDGDVDQTDFSAFQNCYTGIGTFTLSAGCKCFDRDNDTNVDSDDWAAFETCASGPGTPANPTCGS
jgi:hypothetical protein